MRRMPFCLALLAGALAAGSAPAATTYHWAIASRPLGSALVTASPDEKLLTVDNLGSSGQDGVAMDLPDVDGHRIDCGDECTVGQVLTYSWSFARGPRQTVSLDGTFRSRLDVSGDLVLFGGTGEQRRFVFLDHGALVSSRVVSSCSSLSLRTVDGGGIHLPQTHLELDRRHVSYCFAIRTADQVVCTIDGEDVACDQVVVCSNVSRAGDTMTGLRITCAMPPGQAGTLHFTSQSITKLGEMVTATAGTIRFTGTDFLGCAIGSQGSDNGLDVQQGLCRSLFGLTGSSLDVLTAPLSLSLDSPPVDMVFPPHTGYLLSDSDAPVSGSLRCSLHGSGTCSPDGEVAAIEPRSILKSFFLDSRFSSMCAVTESVIVLSRGDVVARLPLTIDGTVQVQAPPGGTSQMALAAAGRPSTMGWDLKKGTKALTIPYARPREGGFSSTVTSGQVALHVAFLDARVFLVGGQQVTGDDIVFVGQAATPPASGVALTISGSNFRFSRTDSGHELDIQDFSPNGGDVVRATIPATTSLSTVTTQLAIPVDFDRVDTHAVRGYSVTFQLSPNLQLAGPVTQGSYLSRSGQTQMFTTTNADGSVTVDCAILGSGCGPNDSGRLFTIPVSRACSAGACAPVDGEDAFVDVVDVQVADCNAGALPGDPGGRSHFQVDTTPPSAVTGLTVTQQKSGNGSSGTTRRVLNWTAVSDEVALYRASYGNYPRYDNPPTPGSVPPQPTGFPPDPRWEPVQLTCGTDATGTSVCTDFTGKRGYDYYMAFARDRAGNVSPPCPMTPGCLNYFLGDIAGGATACDGDNQVTTADISRLGSRYGASVAAGTSDECLDFGAATVDSRPDTDGKIGFRELLMASINYSLVSQPAAGGRPAAAPANELSLSVPPIPAVGQTFDVALRLAGAGDAQGISTQLAWDPAVVEPVAVAKGDLANVQGRDAVVLSAQPGNVDAALLGIGSGFAGEGELAGVRFRVQAAGAPGIGIGAVEARDAQLRSLAVSFAGAPPAAPARTALRLAFPNPFDRSTTVVFALAQAGPAAVRVYDVAGRNVRTLVQGVQPAGERVVAWDGRDDQGAALGAGVYLLRLDAGGHSETRAVRLVK